MTFQYRLERLMKLNESERRHLERHYQILYGKLEELAQTLVELMKKRERLQEALYEKSQSRVAASSIHERLMYVQTIDKKIEIEQKNYFELLDRVELFRRSLTEKAIEVKKHELLKETAFNHYLNQEKKAELKKMDEQAQLVRSYREHNQVN